MTLEYSFKMASLNNKGDKSVISDVFMQCDPVADLTIRSPAPEGQAAAVVTRFVISRRNEGGYRLFTTSRSYGEPEVSIQCADNAGDLQEKLMAHGARAEHLKALDAQHHFGFVPPDIWTARHVTFALNQMAERPIPKGRARVPALFQAFSPRKYDN